MPSDPFESGCCGQNGAARLGLHAGAGRNRCAEGLHQRAAIGLLVVAHAHHVDLAVQAEERAGHRQRRAPLPRAGLRGQVFGAFLLVVVSLRHGGVQLVRAGRADALVLVVDVRRRIERLLKPARAVERRRTPLRINLPHLFGNLDLALAADFLKNQAHGKQRSQIVRADGLMRAGVQRRRQRLGQIGKHVVPDTWNAVLRQIVLNCLHAQHSTSGFVWPARSTSSAHAVRGSVAAITARPRLRT